MVVMKYRIICFFQFFLLALTPINSFSEFIYQSWETKIIAEGVNLGGVSYFEIVIGMGNNQEIDFSPPLPPLFSVRMNLRLSGQNNTYKFIQKEGKSEYYWVIAINPHGNIMPPGIRKSTIRWSPDTFCPVEFGNYRLRKGIGGNGEIMVEDMREISSLPVSGGNTIQYFTIEFLPTEMTFSSEFSEINSICLVNDEMLPIIWNDELKNNQQPYQVLISSDRNFEKNTVSEIVMNDSILFVPQKSLPLHSKDFSSVDSEPIYYWRVLNFGNNSKNIVHSGEFSLQCDSRKRILFPGFVYGRISAKGVTITGGCFKNRSKFVRARGGWYSILLKPSKESDYIFLYGKEPVNVQVEEFKIMRLNLY